MFHLVEAILPCYLNSIIPKRLHRLRLNILRDVRVPASIGSSSYRLAMVQDYSQA